MLVFISWEQLRSCHFETHVSRFIYSIILDCIHCNYYVKQSAQMKWMKREMQSIDLQMSWNDEDDQVKVE